jgi:DNA-binding beta-propeller fold protein YncE
MTVIVGEDAYRFRVEEGWGKLPDGWSLREVGSVGVDARDNVYVFSRSEHPMIVFDREGNFLRSWGEGVFVRPHGIHMGADDTIWCTDDGDHTVRQCTLDGRVLVTIGTPKRPSPYMSGNPFNRCTHTAHSPEGDIYISDGYGNARIHKFSPDGRHLFSWGESGTAPGQFNLPHNIACDGDGWVYVADRESHRIQIFDRNGRYETQWNNLHRPSAMYVQPGCKCPVCYVGECGPVLPVNRAAPNLGPRLSVLDHEGKLLARIGDLHAGNAPGQFISPHGLAVDSHGDLYVGEVSITAWPNLYPDVPPPPDLHCLQKFVRVSDDD